MKEQEYREQIKEIHRLLEREEFAQAKERLAGLYQYKPVRLEWFAAKASYLILAEGDFAGAKQNLADTAWEVCPYPGIMSRRRLLTQICHKEKEKAKEQRSLYIEEILGRMQQDDNDAKGVMEQTCMEKITAYGQLFLEEGTTSAAKELAYWLYCYEEDVLCFLLCLWLKHHDDESELLQELGELQNFGYLKEQVEEESGEVFVILSKSRLYADIFQKLLRDYGQEVWVLLLDGTEDKEEIVAALEEITMQQKQQLVTVLGTGRMADQIEQTDIGKKYFRRLSGWKGDWQEQKFSLGVYGSYLSYISRIYHMDAKKAVDRCPEYDFSIVIPARNASMTLRDTLRTCLEQEYDGTYEIVLSDNSTDDTAAVYELVQELDDPRIHYYRTPRDLQLSKSFEYAFLQSKGAFVFSLGADDALLPWTLQILAEVQKQYSKYPVIAWKRGFYAWCGFNGGQQNQLEIPGEFPADPYRVELRKGQDYLAYAMLNADRMYDLPMLYINSGFRREYMKKLLEETGSLWDGVCQDVYMGVVTVCLIPELPFVDYPLAIAGMSSASMGARGNAGEHTLRQSGSVEFRARKDNNVGGYCASSYERLYPITTMDRVALYVSILSCVARGILPESWMTQVFDWKRWIKNGAEQLDIRDIWFDKKLHMFRYAAMQQGPETAEWFDREIYAKLLQERLVDEAKVSRLQMQKSYREEVSKERIVLDASRYGINNIYDAVRLIVRIKEEGRSFLRIGNEDE